ncbi:MAG: recombinase family protein [Pseudomonadota bacterium]|nr:recombinase family protein [Pseudomonadota bacterium]
MTVIGSAYLRCSDPRQDKSIEQQREEIQRRAAADGVVIPPENWFIDEGLTGRTAKKRQAYQSLLRRAEAQRDARQGKNGGSLRRIDRLYVWAFSRIARNMFDCLRALGILDEADVDVVSLTEPDGGDRSFRKLIRPILAWLAERYSEELSRNVQRGMRSQAEKGFWQSGHSPFGYVAVPGEGGSRLAPDTTIFPLLERVAQMRFVDGDGDRKIAERATRERIPPPSRSDLPRVRGDGTWRPKHVRQFFANLVYTGVIARVVKDPQTGRPLLDAEGRPTFEILCENAHPALFSREQWEQDQRLRRSRVRTRQTRNVMRVGDNGLFTPWMRCGACGGSVKVTNGGRPEKPLHYYNCTTSWENSQACAGFTARVDLFDPVLTGSIAEGVLSPEGAKELIRASLEQLRSTPDAVLASRRSELGGLEQTLTTEISQLVRVASLAPDVEELAAKLTELRRRREEVRSDLAALPEPRPVPDEASVDVEAFRTRILEAWRTKPVLEQRQALSRILDSVIVHVDGKLTIRYAWRDPVRDIHQSPFGPPQGSGLINRGWVPCGEVSRPKVHITAAL